MDLPNFPNWFNSVAPYFEILPQEPLRILQIGTYTGDATEWLLQNRNVERIYDVDTWAGSDEEAHDSIDFTQVEAFYDSRFNDSRITKFKMTSDAFFEQNKDTFNFIYVDGDHTASQVMIDALKAFKVLEPGGIMAFDDYLWDLGGDPILEPKKAIEAFVWMFEGKHELIQQGYQIWIRKL